MIVKCPSCGKKYKFKDSKIKPEGSKVKCPSCGHVFVVYPPKKTEADEEKYMVKTPEGIELGPYSLKALKDLIKKGELEGNEKVSVGGEPFVPITSLPELKDLFPAEGESGTSAEGEEDLFGDLDFETGSESATATESSPSMDISTGELDDDLFGDDVDFGSSDELSDDFTSEPAGEDDLFGDISADELEKGGDSGDEDLFGGGDDDFLGGGDEFLGEEETGFDEGGEDFGDLGGEPEGEDLGGEFEEDIDSDENLAEEVTDEEIEPPQSPEPPGMEDEEVTIGEEEDSGFLEESFEGEPSEPEVVKKKGKKWLSGHFWVAIVLVVLLLVVGSFLTLLFVPSLSNAPGPVGKAGFFVQKLFNTRYYQQRELQSIRSSIYSMIRNHNNTEILGAIKKIETFFESSDLPDAEKNLGPVLFELYLEAYENSFDEKLLDKVKKLKRKYASFLSPYLVAYYDYLMEKFEKASAEIEKAGEKSQKVRLLKGKIYRALGRYDDAGKLLDPAKYTRAYNFIAFKESGVLEELRERYDEAYKDYLAGIKANGKYLYNYMNLLRLVTEKYDREIPQKVIFSLKRQLKKIATRQEQAEVYYLLATYYYKHNNPSLGLAQINKALKIAPNNASYLLLKGKLFYAQGKLVDAFLVLQKALEKNPHSAETFLFLGMTAEGLKKLDKAEEYYKKALKLNPDYAEAYIKLSSLYMRKREYDKAIQLLDRAMETLSNNVKILLQLGRIYILQKKLDTAEGYLKKAAAISPDDPDVQLSFSELLVYKGRYREALSKINRVIKQHPYNDKAYYFRGLAYFNLNNYKKAAEDFKKAKIINQKNPDYYLMYGKALYKLGKVNEAINALERALDLNPNLDEAYFYIALSRMATKSYFQAEDAIKKAIEIVPNNAVYHYYLGLIYEQEKRSGYALDEFKKAVKLDETYVPALLKLGEYYYNLADFEEALEVYERLLNVYRGKEKNKAYFLLGKTLLAAGDPEKAYSYLKKAIIGGYRTAEAYTYIGEAMESLGMVEDAKNMYRKAIKKDFRNPIPHYRLGMIYKDEGDFARAKRELQYALKYNPPQDIRDEIQKALRIISFSSP